MARLLLTAKELESEIKVAEEKAIGKNTRVRISDGDNLSLLVRGPGNASWQLAYRMGGERKTFTIGKYPTITLKRARELAEPVRVLIAKGIDPVGAKRVERAKVKVDSGEWTVRKLMNEWLDKKRGSAVYMGNITAAMTKDVLPAIGSLHPRDVTRQHIVAILRKMERRDALVMLRRLRMYLAQMFDFAMDADIVSSSPVPNGHLSSFMAPEHGHFAALTDESDVVRLMKAIDQHERPIVRTLLLLSAHLFQRPTEMRTARWENFDLEGAKWTLGADVMKMRREHWVPLSPRVIQILKDHKGVVGEEGFLFPGRRYDQPLSDGTANKALRSMGFAGLHTSHGFRAMANTIMVELMDVDDDHIDKQLSHEQKNKVKRAYNRAKYWQHRVELMSKWSDWLDAQMRAPQSTDQPQPQPMHLQPQA